MDSGDVKFVLGMVLLVILIVGAIIGIVYPLSKNSCKVTAEQMNVNWRYSLWTDCMIEINNKWIPLDNYREFQNG